MAIDQLKEEFSKLREIKKARFMENVSEAVQARLADPKPIGIEEYQNLRANTYERRLLAKKYDDSVFLKMMEYSFANSRFHELGEFDIVHTYDHAVISEYLPELLRRFKKLISEEQQPEANPTSQSII